MAKQRVAGFALLAALLLGGAAMAHAASEKQSMVDSGSFGIFVRGQRIATESFQIREGSTVSTATSEFKLDARDSKPSQRTELQITTTGNLHRYEWRELNSGKAQVIVEPSNEFLIEHIIPDPPERPVEHPLILPISTMILDDYVFSQREILIWRYLAQACSGTLQRCQPGKTQFGVFIPRQHASALVTIEYAGLEKTLVRGAQRELNRLNMKVDDVDWVLYIDANLKVVRMLIPAEETEILRD